MDPATLAAAALTVLAPYLVKMGEKVAEKIGEAMPDNAGKLWTTLAGKLGSRPAAATAIQDLAQDPKDEDNQAAFRKELRKALAEDPQFLVEMTGLLDKAQQESQSINKSAVAGAGGTAINAGGSIVTGNNNIVGNHNSVNDQGGKK